MHVPSSMPVVCGWSRFTSAAQRCTEASENSDQRDEETKTADEARSCLHKALVALDKMADEREQGVAERDRLRSGLNESRLRHSVTGIRRMSWN